MSRLRYLTNDHVQWLSNLSPLARSIWWYFVCPLSDDWGRFPLRPDVIIHQLFGSQREISLIHILDAIVDISAQKSPPLLTIYTTREHGYLAEIPFAIWDQHSKCGKNGYRAESLYPKPSRRNRLAPVNREVLYPACPSLRGGARFIQIPLTESGS